MAIQASVEGLSTFSSPSGTALQCCRFDEVSADTMTMEVPSEQQSARCACNVLNFGRPPPERYHSVTNILLVLKSARNMDTYNKAFTA